MPAAMTLLLSLLSSTPALVAESFPDDNTSAWTVSTEFYTEAYDDGRTAFMMDVTADDGHGTSYLLNVWPNRAGVLTACMGYVRGEGADKWFMLFTDPTCADGASYPWMR